MMCFDRPSICIPTLPSRLFSLCLFLTVQIGMIWCLYTLSVLESDNAYLLRTVEEGQVTILSIQHLYPQNNPCKQCNPKKLPL